MDTITIDFGVHTALEFDFTGFDFTGISKVVWTVKKSPNHALPVLFTREFTEPKVYSIIITPQESMKLNEEAVYDFTKVLVDGNTYKNGENGKIELRRGVGQWQKS